MPVADGILKTVSISFKNRGYQLHHKFNRKNFTVIKNWHSVRLIAHLINQLIEKIQQFKELGKNRSKK